MTVCRDDDDAIDIAPTSVRHTTQLAEQRRSTDVATALSAAAHATAATAASMRSRRAPADVRLRSPPHHRQRNSHYLIV